MRLRDLNFKQEYRSGTSNLVTELYQPAIEHCDTYYRAVGYFSSSVFEVVGKPLENFAVKNGTMQLVTSVELLEKDVVAIKQGLAKRLVAEERIVKTIKDDFETLAGRGTAILAFLLEIGCLEIHIALPKHGNGIYHEKVGLFFDGKDYIAFSGSSNESRRGLEVNYECIDVYLSWEEPKRAIAKKKHFESLWENKAEGVDTFTFPDAAKKELIRICRNKYPEIFTKKTDTINQKSKWRHQKDAIEIFLKKKQGILEMATGTGKTRTALEICKKLILEKKVETIIVTADGTDLLEQWYLQILRLTQDLSQVFSVFRHYNIHHERERLYINPQRKILITSRPALPPALSNLSSVSAEKTFLIHDEVHRLGSPGNRKSLQGLAEQVVYRLGLSATPEREYDDDGNEFIEKHIGPVIYKFSLKDAIGRGILSPFNYYPLPYIPSREDKERVQQVYKKAAARKHEGNPMGPEELAIEIAKVYKTSLTKLPIFLTFITENQNLLERCIVFVETMEYGHRVLDIVHRYRHDFHTYFADDEAGVLVRFGRGDLECLLTCHRLSEGIDIQSIQTVILFSSARARLETIQRMGRCLRTDPNNPYKCANIVDFIRQSDSDSSGNNSDEERYTWLSELSKIRKEEDDHE